jgi:hypothetical protein
LWGTSVGPDIWADPADALHHGRFAFTPLSTCLNEVIEFKPR